MWQFIGIVILQNVLLKCCFGDARTFILNDYCCGTDATVHRRTIGVGLWLLTVLSLLSPQVV